MATKKMDTLSNHLVPRTTPHPSSKKKRVHPSQKSQKQPRSITNPKNTHTYPPSRQKTQARKKEQEREKKHTPQQPEKILKNMAHPAHAQTRTPPLPLTHRLQKQVALVRFNSIPLPSPKNPTFIVAQDRGVEEKDDKGKFQRVYLISCS